MAGTTASGESTRTTARKHDGLNTVLSRLKKLLEVAEDYDAEFLPPTREAYEAAVEMIAQSAALLGDGFPFPRAVATADGEGGIRLRWKHGSREVRAWIPAREPAAGYIYHEAGEVHRAERGIPAPRLAKWLRWLLES
jgi:hypothetical protein